MRKFIAGAASFLDLAGASGMAHAVTSEQVPNELVTNGTVDQRRVSSLELSREPNERRDQLLNEGFLKEAEQEFPGYTIETYRNTSNGVTVEYDVVAWNDDLTTVTPYINFEWNWGPRIYITGAEFWSLGSSGFAGAVCSRFAGWKAGAACSAVASAAWNKIASRHAILSDQTCYDLSQFINIGWKRAPQEKCA